MAGKQFELPSQRAPSGRNAFVRVALKVFLPACAVILACAGLQRSSAADAPLPGQRDGFVGSAPCASCHAAESKAWAPSQHAHAMQEASDATVLGDFDDAVATHYSSRARFFRKGGRFLVETEGKDGKTSEFQVK